MGCAPSCPVWERDLLADLPALPLADQQVAAVKGIQGDLASCSLAKHTEPGRTAQ